MNWAGILFWVAIWSMLILGIVATIINLARGGHSRPPSAADVAGNLCDECRKKVPGDFVNLDYHRSLHHGIDIDGWPAGPENDRIQARWGNAREPKP